MWPVLAESGKQRFIFCVTSWKRVKESWTEITVEWERERERDALSQLVSNTIFTLDPNTQVLTQDWFWSYSGAGVHNRRFAFTLNSFWTVDWVQSSLDIITDSSICCFQLLFLLWYEHSSGEEQSVSFFHKETCGFHDSLTKVNKWQHSSNRNSGFWIPIARSLSSDDHNDPHPIIMKPGTGSNVLSWTNRVAESRSYPHWYGPHHGSVEANPGQRGPWTAPGLGKQLHASPNCHSDWWKFGRKSTPEAPPSS